jgi:mono/diheme cytochrome c family protein
VKLRLLLGSLILVSMSGNAMWAADVAAGKDIFGKKCASCHGANGEGKDSIAKMMKVEFRHLGSKEVQAKSDAELMKIITEGGGKMKPVKDVDSKATEDIVSYLRTLRDKK